MHKLPFCPVWQEDERLTVSTAGKDAGSVTHSWGMASVQLCHTRPGCRLCHRQPVHRLCHTQPGAGSVTQSQAQALSHKWPGCRLCHTHGWGAGSVTCGRGAGSVTYSWGAGSVTHTAGVQALSHTARAHSVTHTSGHRLCHTHGQGADSVTHGRGWWNLSGGKLAVMYRSSSIHPAAQNCGFRS